MSSWINFKNEKAEIEAILKLPPYPESLKIIYPDCKSCRRAGRIYNLGPAAIYYMVQKLNMQFRKIGGDTRTLYGKFRFFDELEDKCKNCKSLKKIELRKKDIYCTCPHNFKCEV